MSVILIGYGEVIEFELLTDAIEERGTETIVCDVQEWPGERPLTIRSSTNEAVFGETVNYDDLTGAYIDCHKLFRPYEPRFQDNLTENLYPALNQIREYRGLFESLSWIFEQHDVNVVPSLSKQRWQDRKAGALHGYRLKGIPVPDTLFTNDPNEVRNFFESHDKVIYKPVTRGGKPYIMNDSDLTESSLAKLSTAPVQFQEYINGVDLRVYVLNGDVITAIRYESEHFSFKLDIEDGIDVDVSPATISSAIEDTVTRAAEVAGLEFAAADVRRRPDGSHVLLELNESPRFASAELKADQDIVDILADYFAKN